MAELSERIAKFLMKRFEAAPDIESGEAGELNEVFRHPVFVNGTREDRRRIMLSSSETLYRDEKQYPWDNYFGVDLAPFLQGKEVLDLGCFTGGRTVAWYERYQLSRIIGLDTNELYLEAARLFAEAKGAPVEFRLGKGESLPFGGAELDAILSFEVFEHVQNLNRVLAECERVLRPGGELFVVFPGYFHPTGHHLSLVTRAPCIQCLFSGRAIVRAYNEILDERGEEAAWYKRIDPELAPWERGNTINGTTHAAFRRLLRSMNWEVVLRPRKPVGSVGRNVSRRLPFRLVAGLIYPLAMLPGFEEVLLHRVTYILRKK